MKTSLQLMTTLTLFIALSTYSGADRGYFENCGSASFNGSWTPKVVSYKTPVTIWVEYILPYDFNGGAYNASLYFHGDPDPFMEYDSKFSCDTIKDYIKCPGKKGERIKRTYKITDVENLSSYPGDYDFKLRVVNEKNEEMLCAKLRLVVTL